jgi:hypothetical protein
MKIKNEKAFKIVIDGVELGQDEVNKILAYLQHKQQKYIKEIERKNNEL